MAFVLLLSACGPGNTTNYLTTNGAEKKKQSDDDGYAGTGGTGDGGGGQGILCTAETKNPAFKSKLIVRDIFEAIHNSKMTIKETKNQTPGSMDVSDEAIDLLITSLRRYFGPVTPMLEVSKKEFWRKFIKEISFISEDASLFASQDANSPIALPAGCQISQIAFWDDSNGKNDAGVLYVDKKKWMSLDQLNKIALLAHEYYFKQARKAGYRNSDSVRAKIGQIFANEDIQPLFKSWVPATSPLANEILPASNSGFKVCTGFSEEDPTAQLIMYQYLGKDEEQHLVFPRLESALVSINPLVNQEFTLKNMSRDLIAGTNLLLAGGRNDDENIWQSDLFKNTLEMDFYNAGLLDFPAEKMDYHDDPVPDAPPLMRSFFTYLQNRETTELWSDSLKVNQSYIRIALQNPFPQDGKKIRSAHERMIDIQNIFVKELKSIVPSEQWSTAQPDLVQLIRQLHEDLQNERAKSASSNFKEFNLKFDNFLKKYHSENEEARQTLNHLRDAVTSLMLKASLNLVTEQEITAMDSTSYENSASQNNKYPYAKLIVRQGTSAVNFTLNCDDADRVYSKRFHAIQNAEPKLETISKTTIKNLQITRASNAFEGPENINERKFLNYLVNRAEPTTQRIELMCVNESSPIDICVFKMTLATASKILYEPCVGKKLEYSSQNETSRQCTIVTFPQNQSRFMVWGSVGNEDSELEHVKQLSPLPVFKPYSAEGI